MRRLRGLDRSSCLFCALSFVFSGALPRLADAYFESVSGFTTTGVTVIADSEVLPHALLFWQR